MEIPPEMAAINAAAMRNNDGWKMKRRRPIAILSAAIGAYLVLAPPPDPIAHSVMDDGDGGSTHGEKYSPAQQLSLLRSNEEDETDNSVAETIRPSLERTSSSMYAEKDSKSDDTAALEETTSNTATKVRSKEKASKPLKPKAKKTTKLNAKKTTAVGPLFHMVFTTGSTTLSTLNVRSIESVFHANPSGRLHIHQPKLLFAVNSTSNTSTTLLDKAHPRLAPLIDHGYNITFHRYDPADMLKKAVEASNGEVNKTAAKEFIKSLPRYQRQEFWYSNESNLLRLALLYVQGGTYMDTDVIILRSHDEAFAGGGGGSGGSLESRNASAVAPLPKDGAGAFPENNLIPFPRQHHPFVAAALNNFMFNFNGTVWGNNGPRVLKRTAWERPDLVCEGKIKDTVFAKWEKQLKEGPVSGMEKKPGSSKKLKRNLDEDAVRCVTVLDKKVIQPIGWRKFYQCCVSKKSPTGSKAKALLGRAYAAHLNNRLTGGLFDDMHEGSDRQTYVKGSACDLLMNKYCTVCP